MEGRLAFPRHGEVRAAAATQRMGVRALNKQRRAMAGREGERSYLLAFAFSIL